MWNGRRTEALHHQIALQKIVLNVCHRRCQGKTVGEGTSEKSLPECDPHGQNCKGGPSGHWGQSYTRACMLAMWLNAHRKDAAWDDQFTPGRDYSCLKGVIGKATRI